MSLRKFLRKQRNEKEEMVKTKKDIRTKAGKASDGNSGSAIYGTTELKQWITEELDFKMEDIKAALDIIGLKYPISFSVLNKEKNLVNCATKDKVFTIEFCNQYFPYEREIKLLDGTGTEYCLTIDTEDESSHEVTLSEKSVEKNEKKVISKYDFDFRTCKRSLIIDQTHKLGVHTCAKGTINNYTKPTIQRSILEKDKRIEEYLFNLQKPTEVTQICKEMGGLIDNSFMELDVSYVETVGKEEIHKETCGVFEGRLKSYTIFEEGESLTVKSDGCWQYRSESDNIEISYNQKEDKYNCSVIGRSQLMNLKLSYIEEKVDELVKKVF